MARIFLSFYLCPPFLKVFLFSPFLERIPFSQALCSVKQSAPFSSRSLEVLPLQQLFCERIRSLQGGQVWLLPFLSLDCPVPGFFKGHIRLRLEWSNWSSQGTRLLDSLG